MVEKAWRRGRGVKNDAHNYKVLKSCSWMRRMKGYVDEKVEGGGVKNDVHNYKVLKPCSWMRRMKGLWMKRWRWSGELLRMAYIIIKSSNLCIHSCQYNQYFSVLLNHLSFMTSHLHSSHLYTYTNSDTQPLYLNTTPPLSSSFIYLLA